ncbi:hypothetical protein Taro_042271 [Colocasia esculenta]|uniref:Uncharacterized protein n=1 Tax=Colocasia esculenta TaxID=4460 RepID=A0A843WW10_COLES|nr:hypothetical protein [Colocasia esculenta]
MRFPLFTGLGVWIVADPSRTATVYLTTGQNLSDGAANFTLQPYSRKTDSLAMARTALIHIISGAAAPSCDMVHTSPAVVFSTDGFAGNFFHDINDVLIPVFLTAGPLRPNNLVYCQVLTRLTDGGDAAIVVASSPSSPVELRVHCFPAAVVGVKYHDNLACNATVPPDDITIRDFRRFIHESLSLPSDPLGTAVGERPLLVFLSRRKSRALLNEGDVVDMAWEVGFNVEVVTPEMMRDVEAFARLMSTASALGGVHARGGDDQHGSNPHVDQTLAPPSLLVPAMRLLRCSPDFAPFGPWCPPQTEVSWKGTEGPTHNGNWTAHLSLNRKLLYPQALSSEQLLLRWQNKYSKEK